MDQSGSDLEVVEVNDEKCIQMEELLDSGYIDACVTMHYNFPIGVSTVGDITQQRKRKYLQQQQEQVLLIE